MNIWHKNHNLPKKVVFPGKRTLLLLAFAFFTMFLSSCGNGSPDTIPEGYVIYCLDAEGESLEKEALTLRSVTTKDMIEEILLIFREQTTNEGHLRLLPNNVKILSYFLEDQTLNVNFGKTYADLPRAKEVLARHPDFNKENADEILKQETGIVFSKVLEDAGVYKRDADGKAAFDRFLSKLA